MVREFALLAAMLTQTFVACALALVVPNTGTLCVEQSPNSSDGAAPFKPVQPVPLILQVMNMFKFVICSSLEFLKSWVFQVVNCPSALKDRRTVQVHSRTMIPSCILVGRELFKCIRGP